MNKIVNVYCEIISRCNRRCPYCYNEKNLNSFSELSVNDIRKLTRELKDCGNYHITLSGGEPFLKKDLYEILEMLEEECMEVSIISNGTCFEYMYILKRFQPHLQLTFDGFDAETHDKTRGAGNFEILVKHSHRSHVGWHEILKEMFYQYVLPLL